MFKDCYFRSFRVYKLKYRDFERYLSSPLHRAREEIVIKNGSDLDHNLDNNYEIKESLFTIGISTSLFFTSLFTFVLLGIKC